MCLFYADMDYFPDCPWPGADGAAAVRGNEEKENTQHRLCTWSGAGGVATGEKGRVEQRNVIKEIKEPKYVRTIRVQCSAKSHFINPPRPTVLIV